MVLAFYPSKLGNPCPRFASQWGDDFRPDYGTLNELQQDFQGVPMIAVSGPIGPHIQEDILKKLQMTNPQL